MGRYNGAVQIAQGLPNNHTAIDFTDWQETDGTFKNSGLASYAQDAVPVGNPQRTTEGVLLNGLDQSIKVRLNTEMINVRSALLIYRPLVNQNGYLFEIGEGDGSSGFSVNYRAYQYSDGDVLGDAGSATARTEPTVTPGEINHVLIAENASYSFMYSGVVPAINYLQIGNGNAPEGYDLWAGIGGNRVNSGNSNIEVLFFATWNDVITSGELQPLLDSFNHYGRLLLPTNLESTRHQSLLAIGPTREVTSKGFVFTGETNLDIALPFESGQPVEFFAFDTDENNTNLTTGPIVPSEQEPLVFNPVAGSDGGDPGTGLVAHIAGTVAIDGTGAERQVIVISDDPNGRQVLGEGISAPDGTFDINYNDWGGAVIALALDNYGGDWSSETALASGTIIHPTTPNGYVYVVMTGGTTGSTEPTWSINSSVNDGSVTFNPKPFYRPIASGPLAGEVLEDGTPIEPDFMITHLRLKDIFSQANTYVAINEIIIYDKDASPVDLTGASATATASHSSYPANLAIDGDSQTSWFNEAGVFPVTFEIALLEPTTISAIQINHTGGDSSGIRAPESFDIEVIEDGESIWVLTDSYSGLTETEYASSGQDGVFTVTTP